MNGNGDPFSRTRTGQATPQPPSQEQLAPQAAAAIADQFPGVKAWYGRKTGTCWAYVPRFPRLLEANTFGTLSAEITRARAAWTR